MENAILVRKRYFDEECYFWREKAIIGGNTLFFSENPILIEKLFQRKSQFAGKHYFSEITILVVIIILMDKMLFW